MRSNALWALSLLSVAANASFQGTSPFFAFTTTSSPKPLSDLPQDVQIIKGSDLSVALDGVAQGCGSDAYLLVSQPGVSAKDFSKKNAAPYLSAKLGFGNTKDESVKHTSIVPEVVGAIDTSILRKSLQIKCQAKPTFLDFESGDLTVPEKGDHPAVIMIDFPELHSSSSGKNRAAKLAEHDSFLNAVIEHLPSKSYTVVFTTTPIPEGSEGHVETLYDTDSQNNGIPVAALHTDLKRQLRNKRQVKRQGKDNSTNDRGLFEKYNFLSPGLFMGIFVMLLLVSILSVGLSALSGVKVSYDSFTKEMAQANKKQ